MGMSAPLAAELRQEAATTRRMLERVPEDKFAWRPHEKSAALGRLAGHLAELPGLLGAALAAEELDFAARGYTPFEPASVAEVLGRFDANVAAGLEYLAGVSDESLSRAWRMRAGDRVIFELPRASVVRVMVLNHIVHHRGQLSVYLRLLDVPLPSVYGPTADEPMA